MAIFCCIFPVPIGVKSNEAVISYPTRDVWTGLLPILLEVRSVRFFSIASKVADHVVFLMTINHAWTKARLRITQENGFGLPMLLLVDTPRSFPQSGFQLGAVHYKKGWFGAVDLMEMRVEPVT
jgi:hypothetical protein